MGFSGVFPYLVSPTNAAGEIKDDVLTGLVNKLVTAGVHGLTPLGSTGEFAYLTPAQKRRVIDVTVRAARGRVPVVAGIASTSTTDAVAQTQQAIEVGADGILAILDAYFPLDEMAVESYFTAIAAAAGGRPVVLYTNPAFQRADLSLAVIERLSHIENIGYLKDASTNTGRLLSIIERTRGRLEIFSASAHIPACVMMIGGVGWMAGPACVIPQVSIALYEAAQARDWEFAMQLQRPIWRLNEVFSKYSPAACIKAALQIQGFDVGDPIAPQRPLGPEARAEISAVLSNLGAL